MLQLLVTALTSKAAVAVAIGTLAAGTAAAAAPVLTGGGRPDVVPPKAAEVLDVEAADNATSAAASDERPEAATFGASVAEDARDGGVDGPEISERARDRNPGTADDDQDDDDQDD